MKYRKICLVLLTTMLTSCSVFEKRNVYCDNYLGDKLYSEIPYDSFVPAGYFSSFSTNLSIEETLNYFKGDFESYTMSVENYTENDAIIRKNLDDNVFHYYIHYENKIYDGEKCTSVRLFSLGESVTFNNINYILLLPYQFVDYSTIFYFDYDGPQEEVLFYKLVNNLKIETSGTISGFKEFYKEFPYFLVEEKENQLIFTKTQKVPTLSDEKDKEILGSFTLTFTEENNKDYFTFNLI